MIPHFRPSIIGAGRSPIAAAAYRHRTEMIDQKHGERFRYDKKKDLVHEELALPENAPTWAREMVDGLSVADGSERLWNTVMAGERRADAQFARDIVIALPRELSLEENIALMRDFVKNQLTDKGIIADWVVHDSGDGNPHVHLMHTLRPMEENSFGKKWKPVIGSDGHQVVVNGHPLYVQFTGYKEELKALRQAFADTVNYHMALAGYDAKLDLRSYKERGIDLVPTRHMGPSKTALERRVEASKDFAQREAERLATADKIADKPEEFLKLMTDQHSTFIEKDIEKTLRRFIDDPTLYETLLSVVMKSPELVALDEGIFSTRSMVKLEHTMAVQVDALAAASGFGVSEKKITEAIKAVERKDPSRPFQFDAEQVDAVRWVTADNALAAVVGVAGAGKSTLMEAANLAWVAEGRRVFGAALAGKAAEGLEQSAGIASRTLASWELAWKNGRDFLRAGDVFVIDEAGMVSSKQMARFVDEVHARGAKLVLVGDAMQLQPIEAGAAFRSITERAGFTELIGVRRQRENWAREATRQFARGETATALKSYDDRGHIAWTENTSETIERIVSDWTGRRDALEAAAKSQGKSLRGDELLVLAHRNDDVFALNQKLRSLLVERGDLGEASEFKTARGTRSFAVGDRILFLKNEKFEEAAAPELGRQAVKNGMLGTVTSLNDGLLRVRLDAGRDVAFKSQTYENVDHGYAATVHKSQGVTVDEVFVMGSKTMDQHLSYVAMSRHRDAVRLYAAKTEFRDFDHLTESMGRSGAKTTTLDFEQTEGYRAAILAFGKNRGVEVAAHLLPALQQGPNSIQVPAPVAAVPAPTYSGPVALAGVTAFAESLAEAARARVIEGEEWQRRTAALKEAAGRLYRDPETAAARLIGASVTGSANPRALAERVAQSPETFGATRQAGRAELREARAEMATHARSLAGLLLREQPRAVAAEQAWREVMAVPIPALSERGTQLLREIETARAAGGARTHQLGVRAAMSDAAVLAEIRTINEALTQRFGARAFTASSDDRTQDRVWGRVADDQAMRLDEMAESFAAVRRFGAVAAAYERMNAKRAMTATQGQSVSPVAVAVVTAPPPSVVPALSAPPMAPQTPLFAAVTSFDVSVEEAARAAARVNDRYREAMSHLSEIAPRVWLDPAPVLRDIEAAIGDDQRRDGLLAVIDADPASLGALRGGDRILDRFSAAGAERREALEMLKAARIEIDHAGWHYARALRVAGDAEVSRRKTMAMEVPRLSTEAGGVVEALHALRQSDRAAYVAGVKALPDGVMKELVAFERAVNMRFGAMSFERLAEPERAAARVPEAERARFERLRPVIATALDAKVTHGVEKILAERQEKRLAQQHEQGPVLTLEWPPSG